VWSFAVAEGEAEVAATTREPGDAIAFFLSLVEERRVVIRLNVDRL
jgi:hypothetical protein